MSHQETHLRVTEKKRSLKMKQGLLRRTASNPLYLQ